MKSLKEILEASILADIDDQLESGDEALKSVVKKFIEENYYISKGKIIISDTMNADRKFEVSCTGSVYAEDDITSLEHNMFIWTHIDKRFDCSDCNKLTSLKGAPKTVGEAFVCSVCKSLKSLDGAPETVGHSFLCNNCRSLESLEGAPKEVGGSFDCGFCNRLESLEGAPKKVGISFDCSFCYKLESLEGAPEIVGDSFYCHDCKGEFDMKDVKKVCNVKGRIMT